MSLRSLYERFLSSPNPLTLSDTATLHYVTTLTSFTKPGPIVKHLETQNKNVVKKKSEKVISAVEGQNSIALETETTLEFISSGGAYLPGLDNFIVDHVATIPVTHFVYFDREGKISQIRLNWDQGSLLRQVEVIGARGKNWPVYDGKEQIKIITNSSSSAAAVAPKTPPRGRNEGSREVDRSFSPAKKHIKDPHASLDLFQPTKQAENERSNNPNPVAPRDSAKPPPREYNELFAAGHEDFLPSPGGSPRKSISENVVPPKGAGSRKFETSHLFGDDQTYQQEKKIYKTNPARYNHFDIGDHDENDPMQHRVSRDSSSATKHVPLVSRANRGQSQWDFNDDVTPAKANQKLRGQDAVHFSFENSNEPAQDAPSKGGFASKGRKDAEAHFEMQDNGTPVNNPAAQPKARKDASTHFEFRDDPTPAPRRIIARTKAAAGLYANNQIYDSDEEREPSKAPLSNITNNAGRRKNDAHWDNYDDAAEDTTRKQPVSSNQRKGFEAHWSTGDGEAEATAKSGKTNGRQQDKNFWDF